MIDSILNSAANPRFVDCLGWVLVHSIWQFALIALTCAATMAVMSRRTAAARYVTYCGMLALMGLLPLATWIAIASGAESAQSTVPAVVVGEPDSLRANEATDVVAYSCCAICRCAFSGFADGFSVGSVADSEDSTFDANCPERRRACRRFFSRCHRSMVKRDCGCLVLGCCCVFAAAGCELVDGAAVEIGGCCTSG